LAEGKSKTELAASLLLADGEVDEHLRTLFRRIGVQTPAEAIAVGLKRGLLDYALVSS